MLTATDERILDVIRDHAWRSPWAWPSQARIAQMTGLTREWVCKRLRRMAKLGYIVVRKVKGRFWDHNMYCLVDWQPVSFGEFLARINAVKRASSHGTRKRSLQLAMKMARAHAKAFSEMLQTGQRSLTCDTVPELTSSKEDP